VNVDEEKRNGNNSADGLEGDNGVEDDDVADGDDE
jgi:hypothetical protein